MGIFAFWNCESLKKFKISDKVKKVPGDCFYGCRSLEEVHIGNNVEMISGGAFVACTNVKEFFIPKSVKKIVEGAFSLARFDREEKVKTIVKCEVDKKPDGWDDRWFLTSVYKDGNYEPPTILFGQTRQ